MIKFFRNIRRQLLAENKFTKYMLYAIGEIVLVVVGILIALQINNNSEAKKQEIKVAEIITQIHDELAINIMRADEIIQTYSKQDSLIYLVMNDQVKKEDYKNSNLPFLIGNEEKFTIIDNGYNSLTENLGNLPEKFKTLVIPLKDLFERDKDNVYVWNKEMLNCVKNNIKYFEKYKEWYPKYVYHNEIDDVIINYFLTDPSYKILVTNYSMDAMRNHLKHIVKFRFNAIRCFEEITKVMGYEEKVNDKEYPFIINPNDYKHWLGTYKGYYKEWSFEFEIYLKENTLFEKRIIKNLENNSNRTLINRIFPISKNMHLHEYVPFLTRIVTNKKGEVKGFSTSLESFKIDYKKIN